jgi:cytochrome b6-f complex iron-sulfur subunit
MTIAVTILVILLVAAVTVVVLATDRPRAGVGALTHETRRRDTGATPAPKRALEASGRDRAGETRARFGRAPVVRSEGDVARWERVGEEELGVSRRQFFNRGVAAMVGFSLVGFGAACLGYLWPTGSSGFGGKIGAGKVSDILSAIQRNAAPVYVPEAKAWVVQYPPAHLPEAKAVYSTITYAGMVQGFVALYQRCPHLGCRVPWCQSSQWFECPCHGSKYNRVGEKKAGPAPRGMDRFAFTISRGQMTIDTGDIEIGPPIGTDTTGQQQQGPLCV